jgi:hypothetical protein
MLPYDVVPGNNNDNIYQGRTVKVPAESGDSRW